MSTRARRRARRDERVFEVGELTRVEGEGSLRLRVRDGEVVEARLGIFEAPRYFERLVVGRTPDEVLDIVARICGICPVAYQMTAVHAFEDLFGVAIDPAVRALRRLLYCGEWIESHALHVYLLHAPDFLGYPSALEMAADHRAGRRARPARSRRPATELIAAPRRPADPPGQRPGRRLLARAAPVASSRRSGRRSTTALERRAGDGRARGRPRRARASSASRRSSSLRHPTEYPFNDGRIVSIDGLDLAPGDWGDAFEEHQVEGSNALQARTHDGRGLPPRARPRGSTLAARPAPPARRGGARADRPARTRSGRNIYALDRGPRRRAAPRVRRGARHHRRATGRRPSRWSPGTPRPGVAAWATEAPRGPPLPPLRGGRARAASRTPRSSRRRARTRAPSRPTSRRSRRRSSTCPHAEATHRLEQLIRSYDPCICCATHFLDLTDRGGLTAVPEPIAVALAPCLPTPP